MSNQESTVTFLLPPIRLSVERTGLRRLVPGGGNEQRVLPLVRMGERWLDLVVEAMERAKTSPLGTAMAPVEDALGFYRYPRLAEDSLAATLLDAVEEEGRALAMTSSAMPPLREVKVHLLDMRVEVGPGGAAWHVELEGGWGPAFGVGGDQVLTAQAYLSSRPGRVVRAMVADRPTLAFEWLAGELLLPGLDGPLPPPSLSNEDRAGLLSHPDRAVRERAFTVFGRAPTR